MSSTFTDDIMQLIPTRYFITSGKAVSGTSPLNAFDRALMAAGISEQNLVAVSSVIPDGSAMVDRIELPMGAVTHCVLSQMRGKSKETISAGIAYAYRKDGKGGYVAEGHLHGSGESLRDELDKKVREMSKIRNTEFGETHFVIEEMQVPESMYGCCIASLVFTEYR
ncbi:MAG: pyruvoyl-dependent arginine decarboxylase [Candidatus Methanoplasma sp.]|jgi:arginine decarboxylase|nr:pyruvoyl-dependent arginine decarboxylase [Candidatus Methanoplasma sp.]